MHIMARQIYWVGFILPFSHLITFALSEDCCENYCLANDTERPQRLRFTSKTAYQLAKGHDLEEQFKVPDCSAKKIWIMSRHGTRLPYSDTILNAPSLEKLRDQIAYNYDVLDSKPQNGALCIDDLRSIKTWTFNSSIKPDMARMLTSQGWNDLKGMATTYQSIFPDILTKEYTPQNYFFRHTDNQRARESFKAFAEGLFGPKGYEKINATVVRPEKDDTLLRPYLSCSIWMDNIRKNDSNSEYNKFKMSHIMQKTVLDVSKRLGFQESLEFRDIELMWDICRLEQAWNFNGTSVWCAAFTLEQLIVMEYLDDLKFYTTSSYGDEINSHVPCELVQDMLVRLDGKTQPNAIAYFAHSNTVKTLITALEFYKDSVAPTASNFESMANREWQTSKLNPFASNVVVVKFECPREKAMFFLNQKRVDLDWCKEGLCDWSDVMRKYNHFYEAKCEEYYCKRSDANIPNTTFVTLLLSIVCTFIVTL